MSDGNYTQHPHYPQILVPVEEFWKDVPGYEELYKASTWGQVKSLDRWILKPIHGKPTKQRLKGRILKHGFSGPGRYRSVVLSKDGITKGYCIHTLVLQTFVGPCPEGMECRHLDGENQNNFLNNLCWGTGIEQFADMVKHGTQGYGEKHRMAELTKEQVAEIRATYRKRKWGYGCPALAAKYGVTTNAIWCIIKGITWKDG